MTSSCARLSLSHSLSLLTLVCVLPLFSHLIFVCAANTASPLTFTTNLNSLMPGATATKITGTLSAGSAASTSVTFKLVSRPHIIPTCPLTQACTLRSLSGTDVECAVKSHVLQLAYCTPLACLRSAPRLSTQWSSSSLRETVRLSSRASLSTREAPPRPCSAPQTARGPQQRRAAWLSCSAPPARQAHSAEHAWLPACGTP